MHLAQVHSQLNMITTRYSKFRIYEKHVVRSLETIVKDKNSCELARKEKTK